MYIYTCDTRGSQSHNLWPENIMIKLVQESSYVIIQVV